MLKVVVAPVLMFAIGFLLGLFASASVSPWRDRAFVCAVLWSPVAVLILLRYFGAVEPDALSGLFAVLPRAIELPLAGILVGFGLHTLLTVGQAGR